MPSITTWTRLEPRSRHEDMSAFLEGRLGDPLWSLAVQRRLGEFIGQDAAFPISAEFQINIQPLVADPNITDPQLPIDAILTGELIPDAGWGIELSIELLQLFADHGVSHDAVATVVNAYPYVSTAADVADVQGAAYLQLLSQRIPDGQALLPILQDAMDQQALPAELNVSAEDSAAILNAATAWVQAIKSLEPAAATQWQPESLDYAFTMAAVSPTGPWGRVEATAFQGENLDWFHFDLAGPDGSGPAYPSSQFDASGQAILTGTPHPLPVPGAPDPRYWAMEDGNVNLASMQVDPADLARMLVIEFLTVTAPDWYLQAIPLLMGAVYTGSLSVTNTFGETIDDIQPLSANLTAPGQTPTGVPDWIMFRPRTATDSGGNAFLDGLLLPALTADQLQSPPVESVQLVRDDVFDRAWALETVVTGCDSRPYDRLSAGFASALAPLPPSADDQSVMHYLLETSVPDWAYPLITLDTNAPRVKLAVPDGNRPPLGALLSDLYDDSVQIQQQQVPPWQAALHRQRRLARGPDGQILRWTTRIYRPGGNARSITLDFDQKTSEESQ